MALERYVHITLDIPKDEADKLMKEIKRLGIKYYRTEEYTKELRGDSWDHYFPGDDGGY